MGGLRKQDVTHAEEDNKRKGITAEEVQCREKAAVREKRKGITAEAVQHYMY